MKNTNDISFIKFVAGLLVSIGIGVSVTMQVDIIGIPLAVLVTLLTIISGFVSTKLLNSVAPRREKPSKVGAFAIILFLAAYVVTGKLLMDVATLPYCIAYIVAGGFYVWLVFTAVAETSLIYAVAMGAFFSGFVGSIVVATITSPFSALLGNIHTPAERALVFKSVALICAIIGAFSAISGRLSGWGLAENQVQQTWTFNEQGRLVLRRD